MSETTFLSRIGGWFKRSSSTTGGENGANGDLPLTRHESDHLMETRSTFLRPWAKRDAAISNLQDGFNTLTDLMGTIKSNLEKQNERQTELMGYLSSLPQVMEMIPETNRLQSEALKAIHIQLQGQNAQQERLATILESMGRGSGEQRKMLVQIAERVEAARDTDERISDNLNNVSNAMQTVVRSSQSSAEVMQQMREDTNQR